VQNTRVSGVRFHGVPSFLVGLDRTMEVEGIGKVNYHLAYGGAFYAYVAMKQHNFDFDLSTKFYQKLIRNGMHIKHAVMKGDAEIEHPLETDLRFLYGTIFISDSDTLKIDSKNVCVFAAGEVDRCPTGSGVSGRMAIHLARKEIELGEPMWIEGITGSVFKGSVVSEVDYGPLKGSIPQVEGTTYITGKYTFCIDPNNPMKNGFILRQYSSFQRN
jgi:proline racemase